MRGFSGKVVRGGFGEGRVYVGRWWGGSCLSAGEEFCEKFRLQLLSLIEKIAKLMHPIDGRDFLSRWLCKTPYSKMRKFASFVSFALCLKLLSPKA